MPDTILDQLDDLNHVLHSIEYALAEDYGIFVLITIEKKMFAHDQSFADLLEACGKTWTNNNA